MNQLVNDLTSIIDFTIINDIPMYNLTARWTKSPSFNVNQYVVNWMYNGNPVNPANIPVTPSADSAGYITDFNSANPTIVLKVGDVVGMSVVAVDTVNNLTSTPMIPTPPTITIPATAPSPPINGTLVLS